MDKYCTNITTCRRVQILSYYGENYEGNCNNTCDNCNLKKSEGIVSKDYTEFCV